MGSETGVWEKIGVRIEKKNTRGDAWGEAREPRSGLKCTHVMGGTASDPFPSMSEEKRQGALQKAITCTILSSAGQQRSRQLATLYKDERCHKLPVFAVLKKMYDRLCSSVLSFCSRHLYRTREHYPAKTVSLGFNFRAIRRSEAMLLTNMHL